MLTTAAYQVAQLDLPAGKGRCEVIGKLLESQTTMGGKGAGAGNGAGGKIGGDGGGGYM